MRYCIICAFGHRTINDFDFVESKVWQIIREILEQNDFVEVLVGRNGDFDEIVTTIVKRLQKAGYKAQIELTLVLPYLSSQIDFLEKYYDRVIVSEEAQNTFPKRAIEVRNRFMIERADYVIVYANRNGGACKALQYAKKLSKRYINIAPDIME